MPPEEIWVFTAYTYSHTICCMTFLTEAPLKLKRSEYKWMLTLKSESTLYDILDRCPQKRCEYLLAVAVIQYTVWHFWHAPWRDLSICLTLQSYSTLCDIFDMPPEEIWVFTAYTAIHCIQYVVCHFLTDAIEEMRVVTAYSYTAIHRTLTLLWT